jgi:ribulose-5-phosphate 4-epimerase/fuculose-1-phosphate aldolase
MSINDLMALRRDVAAITRMLEAEHILSYSGHMCARVPSTDHLLIQQRSDSRAEILPERLLVVRMDGTVVEGDGKPPSELAIHLEILKARPDVHAVLHCHMDLAIAFTMMENTALLPMRARAVRWSNGFPIHPDPSHIKSAAQGAALAASLGAHHAALMRAHGLVMVAETPRALLSDAIHFKENAQAMLQVLQAGRTPIALSEQEIQMILRTETRDHHVRKMWNYYARKAIAAGLVPADWALV